VLHGIADARRVTARQIALAFLMGLQAVFAIPKAASGTFRTSMAWAGFSTGQR
jgi:diketogulonate reductase-like aldo/keto reductase